MTGNEDAAAGYVDIPEAGIRLTVVGPDVDPLNAPELDTLKLKSGQMWVQVQPLNAAPGALGASSPDLPSQTVEQGIPANLGGVQVTFDREVRATVLQVANNPGIPIFIIAALMMVGGLVVVFYFPQRRIRGMISAAPDGTTALFAPLARRDWSGKREFAHFIGSATALLQAEPVVKAPGGAGDWEEMTHPDRAGKATQQAVG
jgi:hypothetical protein